MESLILKMFGALFRLVGILMFLGLMTAALLDIQKLAFSSKHVGLVRMLQVNQQLVGKMK